MKCTRRWNDFEVDGPRCRSTTVRRSLFLFDNFLNDEHSSLRSGHLAVVRLLPHGSPGHRRGGLLHLQGEADGDQELLFTFFIYFQLGTAVGGDYGLWQNPEP